LRRQQVPECFGDKGTSNSKTPVLLFELKFLTVFAAGVVGSQIGGTCVAETQ
jgi:hypothetical protein